MPAPGKARTFSELVSSAFLITRTRPASTIMISFREEYAPPPPAPAHAADAELLPSVRKIFCPQGWLQTILRLEHRPQQETMAMAVAQSLLENRPILAEAGTGVGKSLAYLLPSILLAVRTQQQCLISSNTISLQEQLLYKDLPLCRQLFAAVPELHAALDCKATLLVGKANYLCNNRLAQALGHQTEMFGHEDCSELQRIAQWAAITKDGLRQELSPPPKAEVWDAVNADSSSCNNRHCNPENCCYRRARFRLASSHLIVVNHSLLFALLGAGAGLHGDIPGILFPNDFLILDEAHTIPEIATNYFGSHVSSYGLDRLLKQLYNPRTRKGLISQAGSVDDQRSVAQTLETADFFFQEMREEYIPDKKDKARLQTPGWMANSLQEPLRQLCQRLAELANKVKSDYLQEELQDARKRLLDIQATIESCLELSDPAMVYWLERVGRKQSIVHLHATPLDVAPYLQKNLFQRNTAVILTSATLGEKAAPEAAAQVIPQSGAPDSPLASFARKSGAVDLPCLQVASPFDYPRKMRVYIATDAPEISPNARLDLDWLADMLGWCALRFRGGTLGLFTSHYDLAAVAQILAPLYRERHRLLLVQDGNESRTLLVQRFKQAQNALLLGTDSFWTGVDVPGPALSQVVIARLPFANPVDPVAEARAEAVQKTGRNAFTEIILPDAIVQFRQGVGRLIRNQTDCGTITILDSRLWRKTYGKRFLEALPVQEFRKFSRADREQTFEPLES